MYQPINEMVEMTKGGEEDEQSQNSNL